MDDEHDVTRKITPMTPELTRILAEALYLRDTAATTLKELREYGAASSPEAIELANVYVHEQRIINRILFDARDE